MSNTDRKYLIACALDEIEACFDALEAKGTSSPENHKKIRGWVHRNKEVLKELKYRGKIRRLKKGVKSV